MVYGTVRKSGNLCQKSGFLTLNNFIRLVRFSKYDFWIPDQILDFTTKNREKIVEKSMKIKQYFLKSNLFGVLIPVEGGS